ncbi:MAG TPA: response regulator transcription factor [Gemmatimonadaceae bacterium]|nr:response regulator transcription factor [Gemmatimonadaceae bacterium]
MRPERPPELSLRLPVPADGVRFPSGSPRPVSVLVVEDQESIRDLLGRLLRGEHFDVQFAEDGDAALEAVRHRPPDLICLNIELPKKNGMDVLREMRETGIDIPVIILTGHDQVKDRVRGLEAGADDYIAKPFAWPELLARIRALVRRTVTASGSLVMRVDTLELDETSQSVHRAGRTIELTRLEFRLLRYLMRNAGRIVTIKMIAAAVWEQTFTDHSRTYQNSLAALRRKIEGEDPSIPGGPRRLLHTIPGRGYILDPDYKP